MERQEVLGNSEGITAVYSPIATISQQSALCSLNLLQLLFSNVYHLLCRLDYSISAFVILGFSPPRQQHQSILSKCQWVRSSLHKPGQRVC